MKTDLLKEAIADADAIKQLAIENAKASLNESFDSKIKSMLAAKLQEEADMGDEELEETYDDTDEAMKMDDEESMDEKKHMKGEEGDDDDQEDTDESFDIDAILAEMEDGEGDEDMKEARKKASAEDEDDMDDEEREEPEAPKKGKKAPAEDDMDDEESGEDKMEETIDLDALIAEMMGEEAEEDKVDEGGSYDDEVDEAKDMDDEDDKEEVEKMKEELYEIKRQAKQLAAKVNETNLINAKLLYLNKVLRNHTLSEQQKIKVVAAFDKANSVKEAKIVYESLNEALNIRIQNNKTSLKESLGFASKASGTSTKREIISESFADKERWQKLANIRK